ncbi:hypothetical protein P376_0568 [Streptomyces sp. HCCB10043]|nr:hypothetical protein P376_0568 [Streptomyces sp. HCCB10043]
MREARVDSGLRRLPRNRTPRRHSRSDGGARRPRSRNGGSLRGNCRLHLGRGRLTGRRPRYRRGSRTSTGGWVLRGPPVQ